MTSKSEIMIGLQDEVAVLKQQLETSLALLKEARSAIVRLSLENGFLHHHVFEVQQLWREWAASELAERHRDFLEEKQKAAMSEERLLTASCRMFQTVASSLCQSAFAVWADARDELAAFHAQSIDALCEVERLQQNAAKLERFRTNQNLVEKQKRLAKFRELVLSSSTFLLQQVTLDAACEVVSSKAEIMLEHFGGACANSSLVRVDSIVEWLRPYVSQLVQLPTEVRQQASNPWQQPVQSVPTFAPSSPSPLERLLAQADGT